MTPLSELMTARAWEQDWPVSSRSVNTMPEAWGRPDNDAAGPDALLERLFDHHHDTAVSVKVLREAIAHLETWNEWASPYLTFPATTRGLAEALVHGMKPEAPQAIQELTPRLVRWYPQMTWAALDSHADLAQQLPSDWRETWWPSPKAPEPETASIQGAPEPERSSLVRPDRPRRERPLRDGPNWLRDIVLPLAMSDNAPPLVAQEVGEAIKRHHNQTACAQWSERLLLPALMTLSADELGHVMRYWPKDLRFTVEDPVNLVKQPRFWALLRDAEPAAQSRLVNDALSRVLLTEDWSAEDRLRMLRHMLGFAKNSRTILEQRVTLWQQWGGDLNETGVLGKDRVANESDDEFAISAALKSGLDWIREQNVPVWNQWLADQESPSIPARRPSHRMR